MRSKHNSKRIRTLRRGRLALALVAAMAAPVAMAQSLPDTGNVVSGGATIGSTGTQMTITQTTQGAIIDWGTFNIDTGYGVTFDQQFGASSVILNRVVGSGYGSGSMSLINGTLSSNGNVFIVNPAGIMFGSGAVVNVGGLVASTLDISDADFLSGVSSGQYRFSAAGSFAGAIWNNGQLTAADGGTIGLIGSQINNAGTISATNGSAVFGATSQVTLDYFGDGLTQVTVSGNGLGVSNCSVNCNGGITSSGNVFAQGGHIEMRSNTMDGASAGNGLFVEPANGGRIWISGNVSARTAGSRLGSVIIDAGMGNIDLGGVDGKTGNVSANANNAGEDAGTIELRGNQLFTHLCYGTGPTDLCNANNRLGFVNASAFGAGGSAGEIHIDVNHFYHGGVLQAIAGDGSGGLIDITADYAEIYNRIFAFGNNGTGGTINFDTNSLLLFRGQQPWLGGPGTAYWSASLLAYGTTTGGAVNINTGSLVVTDLGNVVPQFPDVDPVINVTGQLGGSGGTININAVNATIGDTWVANASGDMGQGGTITITGDSIDLEGGLSAPGGTVTTTSTGSLFVGSTAYVDAETWLVHAPSVDIMSAAYAVSGYGAVLTDAAISRSLSSGTAVHLFADAALGSGGSGAIHINSGVNIVHSLGIATVLELRATAGIYGSYFDIASTGGPLDLSFTANVTGGNPGSGYVSFLGANLVSSGGDIALNGDGSGVYLEYSQISSSSGDISIKGYGQDAGVLLQQTGLTSTGGDIRIDSSATNGVAARLDTASINSGGGDITIKGDGPDGVSVVYSTLASVGGNISIDGVGIASGSYFHDSTIDSTNGNIAITGSASQNVTGYDPFGVALAGTTLTSTTGDISVIGDAVGGSGIEFWTSGSLAPGITTTSGAISLTSTGLNGLAVEGLGIATVTGDITIVGSASDVNATAGVFVGSSGLHTNGGDISITGTSAGGSGVFLYYGDLTSNGGNITVLGEGFYYGVHVLGGLVSSDAGNISITGNAVGSGSITSGVDVLDGSFASTSGAIAINGSAALGSGVSFRSSGYGPGGGVTTTSGAINMISTGLFGLDVADVPLSTGTGDIRLEGHASGSGPGVDVGSLSTNGGAITLTGDSRDGAGVRVSGDIASNGGDIAMFGESHATTWIVGSGVLISSNRTVDSSGGNIDIVGNGDFEGVVSLGTIASHGGQISILGYGAFRGVEIVNGSTQGRVDSGTGSLNITGFSDGQDPNGYGSFGMGVSGAQVSSSTGDINLVGTGGEIGIQLGGGANVSSAGGNISLEGEGQGSGVYFANGKIYNTSGDIAVRGSASGGSGVLFGVGALGYNAITTTSGAISVISTGLTGLRAAEAQFTTNTGDITLQGIASGSDIGLYVGAGGLSTNGGDITLIGNSVDGRGVQVGGNIASGGGAISIFGDTQSSDFQYGRGVMILNDATVDSGGGTIDIVGNAGGSGVVSMGTIISQGGQISIAGHGGLRGVSIFSNFVDGGIVDSGAGNLSISGVSDGIDPYGYGSFGLSLSNPNMQVSSSSGDITLTGTGGGMGVLLQGDARVSSISGNISITGSGADAGVQLVGADLSNTIGGITISGNSPLGHGVYFYGNGNTVTTTSGAISVISTGLSGLVAADVPFTTDTGDITLQGTATGGYVGLYVGAGGISTNIGDITLIGSSVGDTGVFVNGAGISSSGGSISILGDSTNSDGVHLASTQISSSGGNISIGGDTDSTQVVSYGLLIDGGSNIVSGGGDISLNGTSVGGSGLWLGYFGLASSGGDITLNGAGGGMGGVDIFHGLVDSTDGDIVITGSAGTATGVAVAYTSLTSGNGSIAISGDNASSGSAALLLLDANLTSTAGNIALQGISAGGLGIGFDPRGQTGSSISTSTGAITLMGQGTDRGIVANDNVVVHTQGGDITFAGAGGTGAGVELGGGVTLDAADGVVVIRASNAGGSDAIVLQGHLASTTGVNLRPFNEGDTILLGAGNGFSLTNAELALISSPLLVIGSAQQAGAIRVMEATSWAGNLTLQNQGGNGGIDLQAALGVGDHTLALASGGNITQNATGGITAHSLLAIAGGSVTLTAADNNVAANSLAGSAGSDFSYRDVDDLAIGTVSSFGFGPLSLVSLSAAGITAGGNVLVQAASGNLNLGAGVSGNSIDLVAAETFHNTAGATLLASNGWRIWARTWEGEERGGLQGSSPFDVYGCTFGQSCSGLGQGNQFIYQERRLVQAPAAPETVIEWLDEDPNYSSATDLLQAGVCPVGDSSNDILQGDTDNLAQQWVKSRHRLRLSNCIDNKNAPGCRF